MKFKSLRDLFERAPEKSISEIHDPRPPSQRPSPPKEPSGVPVKSPWTTKYEQPAVGTVLEYLPERRKGTVEMMNKLLDSITQIVKNLVDGSKDTLHNDLMDVKAKQVDIEAKLVTIIKNQTLLADYIGLTPGGATAEDLDALGAKIKSTTTGVQDFDKGITGSSQSSAKK